MRLSLGPNALHRLGCLPAVFCALMHARLRGVVLRVLDWVDDEQVVDRVIRAVVVEMVDVFTAPKRTADVLLHDVAVFEDITAVLPSVRMVGHTEHDVARCAMDVTTSAALHSIAVVAADELADASPVNRRLLAAPAGTESRLLPGCSFVMVREELPPFVVAGIATDRKCASASAGAHLRKAMPAQHVGLAVSKEGVTGDRLPATTRTNNVISHSYQYSRILGKE